VSLIGYTINMDNIKVINYTTSTGKEPFNDWLLKLDTNTRAIIRARIARIRLGNFGDCKIIKGAPGICELRIAYGPGYRVYLGKKGTTVVILLIGGDKRSQLRDIEKAKRYWLEYKD